MAQPISKSALIADLTKRINQHRRAVQAEFLPLRESDLTWQPGSRSWNVLQCFDHLNKSHDYYVRRIDAALPHAVPAATGSDTYEPTRIARVYMWFAYKPRLSFPTIREITPDGTLSPAVLNEFVMRQNTLVQLLGAARGIDLTRTRVPLEMGVRFNLGDCLKVVVYHDAHHIRQAREVLDAMSAEESRAGGGSR